MAATNDYSEYIPILLPVAGIALQWVRQYRKVPDEWTGIIAAAFAGAVYALCFDYTNLPPVQKAVLDAIVFMTLNTFSVLGGTFTASSAAKAGIAVVPMTNSK